MVLRGPLLCALLLLTLGCGDDSASEATAPCDPFETKSKPIELGEIIAAGRDGDGVVYLVDRDPVSLELRAFVGDEMVLLRRVVLGSGEASLSGGFTWYTVSIDATSVSYALIIERDANGTRMARTLEGEGSGREMRIDDLPESDRLETIEVDADDLTAYDPPHDVVVEYLARAPDGSLLVVLRPQDPEGYEDYRLFYGAESGLIERDIMSFTRARDGGSTHIVFALDDGVWDASFPVQIIDDAIVPGPASLEHGGETFALERLDLEAEVELIGDLSFQCQN